MSDKTDSIAIWSSSNVLTHPLIVKILESYGLTGFIFEGYDDGNIESKNNTWSYQLWESGLVSEWYIDRPFVYFRDWSEENLRKIPEMCLNWEGPRSYKEKSEIINSAYFKKSVEILKYKKIEVDRKSIQEWLLLRPSEAFQHTSMLFSIPFTESKYDEQAMYVYDRFRNNFPIPSSEENYYISNLEKAKLIFSGNIELVTLTFKPLLSYSELHTQYPAFFDWR